MEMLAEMVADIRTNQEMADAYQAKMEQMLARLLKERKAAHEEMMAKLDANLAKADAYREEMLANGSQSKGNQRRHKNQD
jgi:hypothetical protein